MNMSYKELLKQREELEAQIKAARQNEVSGAVEKIRSLISQYGLVQDDVFPRGRGVGRTSSRAGKTVAPKYRDPESGQTWTGRGKAPKWIAGKDRDQFAISA